MHKKPLKLEYLLLIFGILDFLVILYWLARCFTTQSSFYCELFSFGAFLILLIPGLILIGIFLASLAFYKWSKGNIYTIIKTILLTIGTIIFIAPYALYVLFPTDDPKTYRGYLEQRQTEVEIPQNK
ncbi:hypothetical protein COB55_01540 [Candidatus Wolfebacteria bacterium]|nr:MAG: hypothetical protein COB55_01540 [Candidatus Wolfebacteria bacterium]